MKALYPSLMAANQLNLQQAVKELDPYCTGYHIDIMDGHFVPNVAMSPDTTNAIARETYKKIWVQLLVEKPEDFIDKLLIPAGSIVSFHIESEGDKIKTIKRIKEKDWLPSITINPKTDVNEVFTYLNLVSQVLIMSVDPGFSGQPFLKDTLSKVDNLVGYRETSGLNYRIGMDGGIDAKNITSIKDHGVDDFSVGSGIFENDNPVKATQQLDKLIS